MTHRTKLPFFIVPAVLAFTGLAQAQAGECTSNADCDADSRCEKAQWVDGCAPEAETCDDTVHEAETGTCVAVPVSCEADSDCGEYLSCEESGEVGSCWQNADGTSGCTEPDPNPEKFCAPSFNACEADTDCPREFECLMEAACPEIACAEGDDCEKPTCEATVGQCVPKQIECEDDSACPSDWSCFQAVETSCSGGDSDGDSGGGADPAEPSDAAAPVPDPQPEGELPPEETTCTETVGQGYCVPDAWGEVYFASDSAGESPLSGAARGESAEDEDGDDAATGESAEASGCSVHGRPGGGSPLGWLLLAASPLLFALRRRQAFNH